MAYDPNVNYRVVARRKALKYGLDPRIFVRQIDAESAFDPDVISGRRASSAGAQGIAQIMPATARGWGVNPLMPRHALDAAAKNMAAYVKAYGGYENALRAYNAGPGAIQASRGYAETNAYVQKILGGRDPGKLSPPRRPGPGPGGQSPRRGGGGRGATPAPGGGAAAPTDAGFSALLGEILGARPAGPPISTPTFAGAAGPVYARGFAPSSSGWQPPAGRLDVGAALGSIPAISGAGSGGGAATAPAAGGGARRGGPVGRTLVIGDSLEAGTFPLLAKMLGRKVHGVYKGGMPSSWGIKQLQHAFRAGKFQNVVFDMGTNDASVDELRASLKQLTQIAGGARVFVSTVNSPWDEGEKNTLLRTYARRHPNVELIRWHKASKGGAILSDGIHGGYEKRANLIARQIGYIPPQRGHTTPGSMPDSVRSMMERANRIDAKTYPYVWGGGHANSGRPDGGVPGGPGGGRGLTGYDCSGAVAAVLGVDARHSSQFAKWGKPGRAKGGRGVTVYANNTHVLMEINGRFFGTSGANPQGGAGWIPRSKVPTSYLSNFTARHL